MMQISISSKINPANVLKKYYMNRFTTIKHQLEIMNLLWNHYDLAEYYIAFVNMLIKGTPHEMHFDDNEMIQLYEFIRLMTCVNTRSIYCSEYIEGKCIPWFFSRLIIPNPAFGCQNGNSLVNIFAIGGNIFLEYANRDLFIFLIWTILSQLKFEIPISWESK